MTSWVEADARIWGSIFRDGIEIWRSLKLSLEQAITDYTRIYTPAGSVEFQFSAFAAASHDCIKVGTVHTNGKPHKVVEVRFNPADYCIFLDGKQVFSVRMNASSQVVALKRENGCEISIEDASRFILQPLFDLIPQRRPNIAL